MTGVFFSSGGSDATALASRAEAGPGLALLGARSVRRNCFLGRCRRVVEQACGHNR
jgi:hypothetical protein